MEPTKSVGIWIRVSTEDQARGESPEHHERRARLYAEAKGWEVHTVYHLEAVSGKSVMEHPEAKKMLKDIKSGVITGLIFSKLARLARNTRELLDFADLFRASNADLVSLQESIDTSSPAGRLFYTMIAAMAQWEREEIADRVKASVPIRAQMGKPLGGQGAYGYRWVDKQFVVDEQEAPVRKLMYELFMEFKRKKTVATELNKRGYRTRNGAPFTDSTVLRLLRDPTAKGERRMNHHYADHKKGLKPEAEWITVPCPAIVSAELWDECSRLLDEQLKKNVRPGPRAVHLLAGYVRCTCGKKMYVFHANNVFACKSCSVKIPATDLEEIYHLQLKSFLLTDTDVSDYMKRTDGTLREKEQLLRTVTDQLGAIKKKMDGLVNLRLAGEMGRDLFAEHYRPLEEQYIRMNDQLPELQAEADFIRIQQLSSDTVLSDARDLYERWPTLPFEEKRSIVETITDRIVVGKEDISISLAYLPPSFQNAVKSQQTPLLEERAGVRYLERTSSIFRHFPPIPQKITNFTANIIVIA